MKRIYLIRHGESEGNRDKLIYREQADFAIPLTERGVEQAKRAGRALNRHLTDIYVNEYAYKPFSHLGKPFGDLTRLWKSPYTRTRQTAEHIMAGAGSYIGSEREHLLLVEQQFGSLNGIAGDEVADHFPEIAADYARNKSSGSRMFARPWGGESRFDCAVRVHQAFGTFHRDSDKHGIENIIVVAHGTVIRAFVMMWLHLPYEWMDEERNPKNCSIRYLEKKTTEWCDRGYIHRGG